MFLHALTQCLDRGEQSVSAVAKELSRQGVAS